MKERIKRIRKVFIIFLGLVFIPLVLIYATIIYIIKGDEFLGFVGDFLEKD